MEMYSVSGIKVVNEISDLFEKIKQSVNDTGRDKEACGLIFGYKEYSLKSLPRPDIFRLTDYQAVDNMLESSTSFMVDPEILIRTLIKYEDEEGKELVAIIHSHPGQSNTPSATDFKFMNYWRIPWFISKNDPSELKDVRVFIMENGQIKEILVVINKKK